MIKIITFNNLETKTFFYFGDIANIMENISTRLEFV